MKTIKFIFVRFLLFLIYRLIRLYTLTFRLSIENEEGWMNYLEKGGTVLLCTWHQQFFSAIRPFKRYEKYRPALMISKSRDGDFIAGVAARSGWYPVRGSSSKDGGEALAIMIEQLKKTRLAGHVVDGPRGPSGNVKSGLIRLAHAADAVIVPFQVFADRSWHMNSWDKFLLPKPFSRVTLRFGDRIRLAPAKTLEEVERQRRQVEEIMRPTLIR